jgi:sterol desaturase/sphingolipid hydroxylase (fatty acid hydroxylase superfamily)
MQDLMLSMGEDLQIYLFFGFLGAFLLAERVFPRRQPTASQARRWRTNAALTAVAVVTLLSMPLSFISAAFWAERGGFGLLNQFVEDWPIAAIVVATLLVRAFISFGTHFLNHKIPLLWRFHRIHHLDTELDVSSTVRVHPIEFALSLVIGLPVVLLVGLSPWVLIFYELLDVFVVLFSHSNLRIPRVVDRYLHYLIVTPDLHKVHHSAYQPETDSNFSAVFPIWDVVFGTFRADTREPIATMRLGLDVTRAPLANSFWWLLASPFVPGHSQNAVVDAQP